MVRRIIQIDREKCNGCGACAAACHEGGPSAWRTARRSSCGTTTATAWGTACPPAPPGPSPLWSGRAAAYDEAAVLARKAAALKGSAPGRRPRPAAAPAAWRRPSGPPPVPRRRRTAPSPILAQWPVQIKLVPVEAPYFDGAKLLIAADCTAYARSDFHRKFMRGRITLIGCPKLDEGDYAREADGDPPPERHPGADGGPDGCALLRRHPAGGGDRPAKQRQVHPLAGGDAGPGWKYSGVKKEYPI